MFDYNRGEGANAEGLAMGDSRSGDEPFTGRGVKLLEELAKDDPIMAEAKSALEQLSRDSRIVELAREREIALMFRRMELEEARNQGRAAAFRESILGLCEALGLQVSTSQQSSLASMPLPVLEATWERIKNDKHWD